MMSESIASLSEGNLEIEEKRAESFSSFYFRHLIAHGGHACNSSLESLHGKNMGFVLADRIENHGLGFLTLPGK